MNFTYSLYRRSKKKRLSLSHDWSVNDDDNLEYIPNPLDPIDVRNNPKITILNSDNGNEGAIAQHYYNILNHYSGLPFGNYHIIHEPSEYSNDPIAFYHLGNALNKNLPRSTFHDYVEDNLHLHDLKDLTKNYNIHYNPKSSLDAFFGSFLHGLYEKYISGYPSSPIVLDKYLNSKPKTTFEQLLHELILNNIRNA